MSKYAVAAFFLSALCLLSACSSFAPAPTDTPVPTQTDTPLPTETVSPTATPTVATASETPDIFTELNPSSVPLPAWNKIPIMPGAIAGDGNDTSYYFTIKASADDIKAYYNIQLAKQGYSPLAVGNGANGAVVLFYQTAAGGTLDISLFTQNDTILVMFVK